MLKLKDNVKINTDGNAATATKATQDSAGQQINTTYIKKVEITDNNELKYTLGNGGTSTADLSSKIVTPQYIKDMPHKLVLSKINITTSALTNFTANSTRSTFTAAINQNCRINSGNLSTSVSRVKFKANYNFGDVLCSIFIHDNTNNKDYYASLDYDGEKTLYLTFDFTIPSNNFYIGANTYGIDGYSANKLIITELEYYADTTIHFLSTNKTNESFTPVKDYDPATKKYVDDNIANNSGGKNKIKMLLKESSVYTSNDLNNNTSMEVECPIKIGCLYRGYLYICQTQMMGMATVNCSVVPICFGREDEHVYYVGENPIISPFYYNDASSALKTGYGAVTGIDLTNSVAKISFIPTSRISSMEETTDEFILRLIVSEEETYIGFE